MTPISDTQRAVLEKMGEGRSITHTDMEVRVGLRKDFYALTRISASEREKTILPATFNILKERGLIRLTPDPHCQRYTITLLGLAAIGKDK